MITIPASLKTEIQKLRGRSLQARCKIDYTSVNSDNVILASSNGMQENTNITQLYNGKDDASYVWASLDGTWILGAHALAPFTEAEYLINEIGWWGNKLSLANNTFQDGGAVLHKEYLYGEELNDSFIGYPEASVNFTARAVQEIKVSFDNKRNEYAVDFDMIFYDIDGVEQYRETVVGNAGLKYSKPITTVLAVCLVKIIIYKWSHPHSQAKILEMYTSVSEMYTGADILNLKIVENRELPEDGATFGAPASGQIVISLVNKDRRFDYDNTESFLYNLIRSGVRLTPEIGDGTDWIPLGIYYAKEWDISKRKIEVTITGVDIMAALGESRYISNQIITAPAPTSFDIDTSAEWNAGTKTSIINIGDSIRMSFV